MIKSITKVIFHGVAEKIKVLRSEATRVLILLFLIVGLNLTGISAIDRTFAYFSDIELSENNGISVETLDFSLSSDNDFSPLVIPTQSADRDINIINDGSLGFQYTVYADEFSEDTGLCDVLQLTANLDEGEPEYTGNLIDFTYNVEEFVEPEDWQFRVSLPEETSVELVNKTCNFKFIFSGTQLGDCLGFSDNEEIENIVTSGEWEEEIFPTMIINKVYYDVDEEHGVEYKNEWIEVYNPNDSPVDISGWLIEDNFSSDIIPVSNPIPSLGFALIAATETATESTFDAWEIPEEVIKIALLDGKIGNGLDNEADMLILKSPNSNIIDQMNWGIPDENWLNYNPNLWNPGCPDVLEGHILGRVPSGYDTDQASDFIDLSLPDISVSYHTGAWYCGHTYTVNWTAINNNGDAHELEIDIIYITDNDRTGTITDGDNVYLVENHIANTGTYEFYVDQCQGYCYYGYVWVKIIAYGPENFIINDYGIGPRVFEPPCPEDSLAMCPFEEEMENDEELIDNEDIPEDIPEETNNDVVDENTIIDIPDIAPIVDIPDIEPIDTVTPIEDGLDTTEDTTEDATEGVTEGTTGDITEDIQELEQVLGLEDEIIEEIPVINVPDVDVIDTTTSEQDGLF